jgi:hypothetical protein
MKTLLFVLGTALLAPSPFGPACAVAASAPSSPAKPVGSATTGILHQINVQVAAAAEACRRGDDAAAIQLLQTPAAPASIGPAALAIDQGWRLYRVALLLASQRDFATARRVANLALDKFVTQDAVAGTAVQRAQALELCGSLQEHVLGDMAAALADYHDAVKLDPARRISAARAKALTALPAAAVGTVSN